MRKIFESIFLEPVFADNLLNDHKYDFCSLEGDSRPKGFAKN